MITKRITYTDFDGTTRTETYYFNLTKTELAIMNNSAEGSFRAKLQKIIDANDTPHILDTFLEILKSAYGVKSDDGRRLMKSEELWTAFKESNAFDELFMELTASEQVMIDFVRAILPEGFIDNVAAVSGKITPIPIPDGTVENK